MTVQRNDLPEWSRDLDSPEWQTIFADPRWTALVRELDALRRARIAAEAEHDETETAA